MPRTWPADWDARRGGHDCPKCAEGRPSADRWGVRFFAGRWADAYLERQPPQPGTAVVIFRGSRHVDDPCDFTDDELAGYWTDVRTGFNGGWVVGVAGRDVGVDVRHGIAEGSVV